MLHSFSPIFALPARQSRSKVPSAHYFLQFRRRDESKRIMFGGYFPSFSLTLCSFTYLSWLWPIRNVSVCSSPIFTRYSRQQWQSLKYSTRLPSSGSKNLTKHVSPSGVSNSAKWGTVVVCSAFPRLLACLPANSLTTNPSITGTNPPLALHLLSGRQNSSLLRPNLALAFRMIDPLQKNSKQRSSLCALGQNASMLESGCRSQRARASLVPTRTLELSLRYLKSKLPSPIAAHTDYQPSESNKQTTASLSLMHLSRTTTFKERPIAPERHSLRKLGSVFSMRMVLLCIQTRMLLGWHCLLAISGQQS